MPSIRGKRYICKLERLDLVVLREHHYKLEILSFIYTCVCVLCVTCRVYFKISEKESKLGVDEK